MDADKSQPHLEASTTTLKISAPAKVNLSLKIIGRRDDGYHELESFVAFAPEAADHLTFSPSCTPSVSLSGPFSEKLNGDNLVTAAMEQTRKHEPRITLAKITLEKNIPLAAGLGGGSTDAAATLRALAKFNSQFATNIDWQTIARNLGADVPVCLHTRAAIMRGIGDKVTPIKDFPKLFAVLANPQIAPPQEKTARVFAQLDARPINTDQSSNHHTHLAASCLGSADDIARTLNDLKNDLEIPATAVMPEIAKVKEAIKNSPGCILTRLSGAGPTCFGLYKSSVEAKHAAKQIKQQYPTWWVKPTTLI